MPAHGPLGSLVLRTSKAGGITPGRGADVWKGLDNTASWSVFIQTAVNSLQDDNQSQGASAHRARGSSTAHALFLLPVPSATLPKVFPGPTAILKARDLSP